MRYRVNSFVPPSITGLERIYFIERKALFGWREVVGVRGKTPEEALRELARTLRTEETFEFEVP